MANYDLTTYFKLKKPIPGQCCNWGELLNQNLDIIDALLWGVMGQTQVFVSPQGSGRMDGSSPDNSLAFGNPLFAGDETILHSLIKLGNVGVFLAGGETYTINQPLPSINTDFAIVGWDFQSNTYATGNKPLLVMNGTINLGMGGSILLNNTYIRNNDNFVFYATNASIYLDACTIEGYSRTGRAMFELEHSNLFGGTGVNTLHLNSSSDALGFISARNSSISGKYILERESQATSNEQDIILSSSSHVRSQYMDFTNSKSNIHFVCLEYSSVIFSDGSSVEPLNLVTNAPTIAYCQNSEFHIYPANGQATLQIPSYQAEHPDNSLFSLDAGKLGLWSSCSIAGSPVNNLKFIQAELSSLVYLNSVNTSTSFSEVNIVSDSVLHLQGTINLSFPVNLLYSSKCIKTSGSNVNINADSTSQVITM